MTYEEMVSNVRSGKYADKNPVTEISISFREDLRSYTQTSLKTLTTDQFLALYNRVWAEDHANGYFSMLCSMQDLIRIVSLFGIK